MPACRNSAAALARKDLEYLSGLSLEELEHVLRMQGIRRYLLTNSLDRAYQLFYIPKTIKKGIRESVNQKPEEEYPGAREMKRRFILHVGPTNSGKTHDALERLKECGHGAYFGPLRLLALEVYDKLNSEGLGMFHDYRGGDAGGAGSRVPGMYRGNAQ